MSLKPASQLATHPYRSLTSYANGTLDNGRRRKRARCATPFATDFLMHANLRRKATSSVQAGTRSRPESTRPRHRRIIAARSEAEAEAVMQQLSRIRSRRRCGKWMDHAFHRFHTGGRHEPDGGVVTQQGMSPHGAEAPPLRPSDKIALRTFGSVRSEFGTAASACQHRRRTSITALAGRSNGSPDHGFAIPGRPQRLRALARLAQSP